MVQSKMGLEESRAPDCRRTGNGDFAANRNTTVIPARPQSSASANNTVHRTVVRHSLDF